MFKGIITPEMHYDDWAQHYDSDMKGWGYHAPGRVRDGIRTFLQEHPAPAKLLDVGIGTGLLSRKCRAVRSDLHITGVDVSVKMLDVCARRGVADDLCRADVSKDRFPFEDGHFDAVVAAGLMENVGNINNTLSEMARVTRPGGLVAFTYMPTTRHDVREKLAKKLRPGRTQEGRFVMGDLHLFRHNPERIGALMHREGVSPVARDSFVGYRTYVVMAVRYDLFVGRKARGLQ